jgi:hypothetical protein
MHSAHEKHRFFCGIRYAVQDDRTGQAWTWGLGGDGQLGHGDDSGVGRPFNCYVPHALGLKARIIDMAVGYRHTLAVTGASVVCLCKENLFFLEDLVPLVCVCVCVCVRHAGSTPRTGRGSRVGMQ